MLPGSASSSLHPLSKVPPRLDVAILRMREHDPRPWGWRPVVVPCVALVVLVAAANVAAHLIRPTTFTGSLVLAAVLDIGLYAALAGAVRAAGADVVARYGGWGNTLGLRRPVWRDGIWVAAGIGIAFGARLVIAIIAAAALGSDALTQSQNLRVGNRSAAVWVVLIIVAVGLAPVIEETIFRGLLLRSFMRRLGFWPAAFASSALFGAFHTYEVDTLSGAVILAAVTGSLGVTNCLLVRWTERLTPGIGVHMLFNGFAIAVLALR